MLYFYGLTLILVIVLLLVGCTTSHVHVNNGKGSVGHELDARVDSEINSEITGIQNHELQRDKDVSAKIR